MEVVMNKEKFLKINTQLFAEDTVQEDVAENQTSQENQDNNVDETKEDKKRKNIQ